MPLICTILITTNKNCTNTEGVLNMTMYQEGYEVYVKKCEQFGLEPVNFRLYVNQLSKEQLFAYNEQARHSNKGDY